MSDVGVQEERRIAPLPGAQLHRSAVRKWSRAMIALGINSVYHESSAAIVVDGRLVAAVEEERFNRCKHGKPARVDNPHQPPARAIEFCLRTAGGHAAGVDARRSLF